VTGSGKLFASLKKTRVVKRALNIVSWSARTVDDPQAFTKAVIASVMAAEAAKIERIAVIAFMFHSPGR